MMTERMKPRHHRARCSRARRGRNIQHDTSFADLYLRRSECTSSKVYLAYLTATDLAPWEYCHTTRPSVVSHGTRLMPREHAYQRCIFCTECKKNMYVATGAPTACLEKRSLVVTCACSCRQAERWPRTYVACKDNSIITFSNPCMSAEGALNSAFAWRDTRIHNRASLEVDPGQTQLLTALVDQNKVAWFGATSRHARVHSFVSRHSAQPWRNASMRQAWARR